LPVSGRLQEINHGTVGGAQFASNIRDGAAGASGAVEAGESEYLAGHEFARFLGGHHPGQRRHDP